MRRGEEVEGSAGAAWSSSRVPLGVGTERRVMCGGERVEGWGCRGVVLEGVVEEEHCDEIRVLNDVFVVEAFSWYEGCLCSSNDFDC